KVAGLKRISDTIGVAAGAVEETARALDPLGSFPLIGPRVRAVETRARQAARSARDSAESSKSNIGALSLLLGFAVALAPTVPLVAIYLPLRLRRVREVRGARKAWGAPAGDTAFREFLARRALQHLSYRRLREVSGPPWRDVDEGRYDALARAELRRLGL